MTRSARPSAPAPAGNDPPPVGAAPDAATEPPLPAPTQAYAGPGKSARWRLAAASAVTSFVVLGSVLMLFGWHATLPGGDALAAGFACDPPTSAASPARPAACARLL